MTEDGQIKLHKTGSVPFAMRLLIEQELDQLLELGVIEKVKAAKYSTTPIISVLESNGHVRICGDFKISQNRYCDFQQYPLRHIEVTFTKLRSGHLFSKLDQHDAYLQKECVDES